MKLIGLYGVARSGKDEVGKAMLRSHGYSSYAFADPIRSAAVAMFGLPKCMFDGDNPDRETVNEFWGFSPREMLQKLGTEGGRNVFGYDIWVKRAQIRWAAHVADFELDLDNLELEISSGLVITDVRFDNEAKWIIDEGGCIIHVLRPLVPAVNDHVSEQGIDPSLITHTLLNDGTLGDLNRQVHKLLGTIEYREQNTTC